MCHKCHCTYRSASQVSLQCLKPRWRGPNTQPLLQRSPALVPGHRPCLSVWADPQAGGPARGTRLANPRDAGADPLGSRCLRPGTASDASRFSGFNYTKKNAKRTHLASGTRLQTDTHAELQNLKRSKTSWILFILCSCNFSMSEQILVCVCNR